MASASPPLYEAFAVPADLAEARRLRLPKLQIGHEWLRWLSDLVVTVDRAPTRAASTVRKTAQMASIGVTPLPLATIPPGLYRVSYRCRVTTPAGVSSSLSVTITWTEGAVVQTETSAALTGNATTTHGVGTVVLRSDANTPISYSTTYASNPGAAMVYDLDLVIEALALDVT